MAMFFERQTEAGTEHFCALCDVLLTSENNSAEHLIPNGIGGQKRVRNVLCKDCNSLTGMQWDADVTKQLNSLNLIFAIKRDRGSVRAQDFQTTSGETMRVHSEGHLTHAPKSPVRTQTEEGTHIKMRVGTLEEAKTFVQGLKRKNPHLDINKMMGDLKIERSYMQEPLLMQQAPGGPTAGRSFVKSAFTLAVVSGVSPKTCKEARDYLLHKGGDPCFDFFYKRDVVINRPLDRLFHCVAVKGDPATRQLVGYVELYRTWRMMVTLSSRYEGAAFENSYAVDPIAGTELDLSFDLAFTREELREACYGLGDYYAAMIQAHQAMMAIGYPASLARERERVMQRAFVTAMERLGVAPGDTLPAEQSREFANIFVQELMPCLLHQISLSRGRHIAQAVSLAAKDEATLNT